MAFYNTCPLCGSNLDPGEPCNCEREREQENTAFSKWLDIESEGQFCFSFTNVNNGGIDCEKVSL